MSDTQIIYSMIGVSKSHEKKPILKDINLSYYYGAKIGVLGLNGSGKSSLLKHSSRAWIKDFEGKVNKPARIHHWVSAEQEPLVIVTETRTVIEVVREGVKHDH